MTTEITLANPRNDAEAIAKMRQLLMDNQRDDVAEIEAATADINGNGLGKAKKNAFDATEKRYKTAHDALLRALLKDTGADAIAVQCAASQTAVRNAVKAYKTAWDAAKTKDVPPEPIHSYVVQMDVTDSAFKKVVELLAKSGAAYRYVGVDNKDGKADRFFAANGWKEPEAAK